MPNETNETAIKPITAPQARVRPEWIDYNGHMNVAYYVLAFDLALEEVFRQIGLGNAYREKTNHSTMTLEMHVNYLREIMEGEPYDIDAQILGVDAKRMRIFHVMRHGLTGERLATSESMLVHVSLEQRRSVPFPDSLRAELEALAARHAELDTPPEAGRSVGFGSKR